MAKPPANRTTFGSLVITRFPKHVEIAFFKALDDQKPAATAVFTPKEILKLVSIVAPMGVDAEEESDDWESLI